MFFNNLKTSQENRQHVKKRSQKSKGQPYQYDDRKIRVISELSLSYTPHPQGKPILLLSISDDVIQYSSLHPIPVEFH